MQVHVALLFANEGLVAIAGELLPDAYKVLHHVDVRTCLDVEVTCIKVSSHIESRNELQGLILRVGGRSLRMEVEMVARRSLQIAFLERLAVPDAIAFVHGNVVHVDGNPHVGGGIGDLVIDAFIDEEVARLGVTVFDEVDAWLFDFREVELHIFIFKVVAPKRCLSAEGCLDGAIGLDAADRSLVANLVPLVKFYHGHLWLVGQVAHLAEADVRFAYPSRDSVRLDTPTHHLARLAGRQYTLEHVPAVLREHAAIVKVEFRILA